MSAGGGVRLSGGAGPGVYRLIVDATPRPGAFNMAADQALADETRRTGEGHVRLYRWAPYCLSLGRHEPARRYDRARIETLGLDVVRRPTGGRAVWHARELTYAVTAPVGWLGGLRDAYLTIHRVLAAALRRLGADATLAPRPRSPAPVDAGACFARPAGGEVLVAGRKVVGSAQVREGGVLLQHGSILLEDDQEVVRQVTAGPAPTGGEGTLSALLGRRIGFEEAADAVAAEVRAAIGECGGVCRDADPAGLGRLAEPHLARFGSPEWIWGR